MQLIEHKSGLMIRPKPSYDTAICGEMNGYDKINFKGAVILDIGACFGAFANLAINRGAKHVISYEPDPENWEMLEINKSRSATNIKAAVVGDHSKTISFYRVREDCKNMGRGGTTPTRGREEITVAAVNFQDQLDLYKPDIIKMDIEGGEYSIFPKYKLPKYVKGFLMEIHTQSKAHKALAPGLLGMFNNVEWLEITAPKLNNWASNGIWVRNY